MSLMRYRPRGFASACEYCPSLGFVDKCGDVPTGRPALGSVLRYWGLGMGGRSLNTTGAESLSYRHLAIEEGERGRVTTDARDVIGNAVTNQTERDTNATSGEIAQLGVVDQRAAD